MSQIALPLPHRTASDPHRIIIGNANEAAHNALRDPQSWPFGTAILAGPSRCGKSLLGTWAVSAGVVVLDNADSMDETQLFHRWNAAQEQQEKLLLIVGAQPWEITLPDLRSRLGAALHIEISEPDDAMTAALIEAMAEQRGLALADGAAVCSPGSKAIWIPLGSVTPLRVRAWKFYYIQGFGRYSSTGSRIGCLALECTSSRGS